jgi:hypothetical protein
MAISLPDHWIGWWEAEDGKAVFLERGKGGVLITVAPAQGSSPYQSARLLSGRRKRIRRLRASCLADEAGRRYLEIEAGTNDLGPTYRLYPVVARAGRLEAAPDDAPRTDVVLLPEVNIGLYDDWDDDLGVPWAEPLLPFQSVNGA